jgi:hypothetical protein
MIEFAVAAVPLLLLLVALLLGRYPGCDAALRLAERIASWVGSRPTATSNSRRPHPPASYSVGGGLLLACGLSGRAPPV